MQQLEISSDPGYGTQKFQRLINNQFYFWKYPTSITYAPEGYTNFGADGAYEFEGEKYFVATSEAERNAFTTRSFKFLFDYSPLFLVKNIEKSGGDISVPTHVTLYTGLSLQDWQHKNDYINRLSSFTVNGVPFTVDAKVFVQGEGIYKYFLQETNTTATDHDMIVVLDGGSRTVDMLVYEKGVPSKSESYCFNDCGTLKMVNELKNFIDNKYGLTFSETKANEIFLNCELKVDGVYDTEIGSKIKEIKLRYLKWLMNEILAKRSQVLKLADYVIISGGLAYFLEDMEMPGNVYFSPNKRYEFHNVIGYML